MEYWSAARKNNWLTLIRHSFVIINGRETHMARPETIGGES